MTKAEKYRELAMRGYWIMLTVLRDTEGDMPPKEMLKEELAIEGIKLYYQTFELLYKNACKFYVELKERRSKTAENVVLEAIESGDMSKVNFIN